MSLTIIQQIQYEIDLANYNNDPCTYNYWVNFMNSVIRYSKGEGIIIMSHQQKYSSFGRNTFQSKKDGSKKKGRILFEKIFGLIEIGNKMSKSYSKYIFNENVRKEINELVLNDLSDKLIN